MTKLVWDRMEDRNYQFGIDRGVLYPKQGVGVCWNGLISVDETVVGGEKTEFFYDGVKYIETIDSTIFQATIKAYTAPREFQPCVGIKEIVNGFFLTAQPRERFGLSYRTRINENDYKIHLIYNATASPSTKGYISLGGSQVTPSELEWKVDAVPIPSKTYKATAHYVVDSTKADPYALTTLETLLYGDEEVSPALVDQLYLAELFKR